MAYILFDLEWNQPYSNDLSFLKNAKMPLAGEIIQIGAVKLDDNLQIIDKFSTFVKPKYLRYMHKHVQQLTGITENDIARAPFFPTACAQFLSWCGKESTFLSWGVDDMSIFHENAQLHRIKGIPLDKYINGQLLFTHYVNGNSQQVSLKKAMEHFQIESGKLEAHNALHDAIFMAEVMVQLPLAELIAQYDAMDSHHPLLFPSILSFFFYDNMADKRTALQDRRMHKAFCPFCQHTLKLTDWESVGDSRYLSLGLCDIHKTPYAVVVKLGKYTKPKGDKQCYAMKMVMLGNEKIYDFYQKKSAHNKARRARREERRKRQEENKEVS